MSNIVKPYWNSILINFASGQEALRHGTATPVTSPAHSDVRIPDTFSVRLWCFNVFHVFFYVVFIFSKYICSLLFISINYLYVIANKF